MKGSPMGDSLSYAPDWRGDETLYSWAAGFHQAVGNGSARDTGRLLFGAEHACRDHDAPTKLSHFVQVTRGRLGDVPWILRHRTPLALFVPFLSLERSNVLASRMLSAEGVGWSVLCGMPASSLNDRMSMRYCPACLTRDMDEWGSVRWRLPHQLLGAWLCLEHRSVLVEARARGSEWILPETGGEQFLPPTPDAEQLESIRRMALLASRIVGRTRLDVDVIRQCILGHLREQGVTCWLHPLDRATLATWFAASPIAGWMGGVSAPLQKLSNGHWVYDVLRNRVGDHPIKWMLLWTALFSNDSDPNHQRFLDPQCAPHWDANGQGCIWDAASCKVPSDVAQLIASSSTLRDAAAALGLTVFSLRKRLADLGTSARVFRLDSSLEHRRRRAMDAIGNYIAEHPTCSKADIHRDCKAAVSWLRSNDPGLFSTAVGVINDRRPRQMELIPIDAPAGPTF